jgi:glycosyltransferase involved in cell wall biosynthesis
LKIAFVANFCPHYRVKTFERLAAKVNVDFFFFSEGEEWYWQQNHGVQHGAFHHEYLRGWSIRGTRLTPSLATKLWHGNYDIFIKCINGRFALPTTYAIARMRRKPFILWTGIWQRLLTPAHRLFFPITQHIYRHADAVVSYGEHVRQFLISEGADPQRVFVAHHAVDNAVYNRSVADAEKAVLRTKLNLTENQRVILYLGRLEEGKGVEYLLEAFARITDEDVVLVIVGSGAWSERCHIQATSLGIDHRVRFAGYVPTSEATVYYALAWTTVVPSYATKVFREPWGLVVNESFNQATPVIATDSVGAAAGGLVEHNITGLIVPEKNINALADSLHTLLNNLELRTTLADNARRKIATWDNEWMVQGFLNAISFVQHH